MVVATPHRRTRLGQVTRVDVIVARGEGDPAGMRVWATCLVCGDVFVRMAYGRRVVNRWHPEMPRHARIQTRLC